MKKTSRFKYALYRIQLRWALTQAESRALTTLVAVLLAGILMSRITGRSVPFDPDAYASLEQAFADASTAIPKDTTLADPPTVQPVNINTAGAAELQGLPRIGPRMAERIIAHRDKFGPFRDTLALLEVSGIGPKTLALLTPLIRLDSLDAEREATPSSDTLRPLPSAAPRPSQ